jgi:hypothetical protein
MADPSLAERAREAHVLIEEKVVLPEREVGSARGSLPGPPTDPDVPDLGIRLFGVRVRYVNRCTMAGRGSGYRFSSRSISGNVI